MKAFNNTEFSTLADAKAYEVLNSRLIHRDTMNGLLAQAGIYVAFKDIAADSANPFQNLAAAFLDSVEFNFRQDSATGIAQIASFDSMIAADTPLKPALTALKPIIIGLANPMTKPYENKTLHDWKVANKDETRFKQIGVVDGIASITVDTSLNTDFEAHRPQIYFKINGVYERRAGFTLIEESGVYNAQCPTPRSIVNGVFVDDSYGVVL